jgi:hypothetical protein
MSELLFLYLRLYKKFDKKALSADDKQKKHTGKSDANPLQLHCRRWVYYP